MLQDISIFPALTSSDNSQLWSRGSAKMTRSTRHPHGRWPRMLTWGVEWSAELSHGDMGGPSIPQNGWFIREKSIEMDDLGGSPYFRKPPYNKRSWFGRFVQMCGCGSILFLEMDLDMNFNGHWKKWFFVPGLGAPCVDIWMGSGKTKNPATQRCVWVYDIPSNCRYVHHRSKNGGSWSCVWSP